MKIPSDATPTAKNRPSRLYNVVHRSPVAGHHQSVSQQSPTLLLNLPIWSNTALSLQFSALESKPWSLRRLPCFPRRTCQARRYRQRTQRLRPWWWRRCIRLANGSQLKSQRSALRNYNPQRVRLPFICPDLFTQFINQIVEPMTVPAGWTSSRSHHQIPSTVFHHYLCTNPSTLIPILTTPLPS